MTRKTSSDFTHPPSWTTSLGIRLTQTLPRWDFARSRWELLIVQRSLKLSRMTSSGSGEKFEMKARFTFFWLFVNFCYIIAYTSHFLSHPLTSTVSCPWPPIPALRYITIQAFVNTTQYHRPQISTIPTRPRQRFYGRNRHPTFTQDCRWKSIHQSH